MDAPENSGIPVIFLAGPTATGKSKMAVDLALRFDAEIVSADSMQVYEGLDIGTAKLNREERRGVAHHMIDIVSPDMVFSVADYVEGARKSIADISADMKLPIICGGTGLYISSLLDGIDFKSVLRDTDLSAEVEAEYARDNGNGLLIELAAADPQYAAKMNVNDRKRIVRAVEILRAGQLPSEAMQFSRKTSGLRPLCIILVPRQRQALYNKINERVDKMIENGLIDEARYVYDNRNAFLTAAQAIGYKELFPFFESDADVFECIDRIKQSSRRYAKRQMTWFRRYTDDVVVDAEEATADELSAIIEKHLKV